MTGAGDGKNRTKPSTAVYRLIMVEFERQRLARGLSMAQVDDMAGTQDGYYAKMLYPDTPLGRQSRWETVQDVADALFGRGFEVHFAAAKGIDLSAVRLDKGASNSALQVRHWRHLKHFETLGRNGGHARALKLTPERRIAIAKKASRAAKRARKAQQQGSAHAAANAAERGRTLPSQTASAQSLRHEHPPTNT